MTAAEDIERIIKRWVTEGDHNVMTETFDSAEDLIAVHLSVTIPEGMRSPDIHKIDWKKGYDDLSWVIDTSEITLDIEEGDFSIEGFAVIGDVNQYGTSELDRVFNKDRVKLGRVLFQRDSTEPNKFFSFVSNHAAFVILVREDGAYYIAMNESNYRAVYTVRGIQNFMEENLVASVEETEPEQQFRR